MIKSVKFICRTCEDRNKSELGMDEYYPVQTEYDNVSDAWLHLMETYQDNLTSLHHMEAMVDESVN